MTVIKQKGVSSERHGENVRRYLNGKDAVLRGGWNIEYSDRWYAQMSLTREGYGHNAPARANAKNTIMYHQILAFLPEECSCNGGKMTPELCMKYAMEYVAKHYTNQQVVFALHEESDEQGKRYAVHMAINRTDLSTGNRLHEGTGKQGRRKRVEAVRGMDAEWGLKELEENVQNSKMRKRQPRAEEKLISESGRYSYKHVLRTLIEQQVELPSVKTVDDLCSRFEDFGFSVEKKANDILVTDLDAEDMGYSKCTFSLKRFDGRFSVASLDESFAKRAEKASKPKDVKADYLARVDKAIDEYRESVIERGARAPRFKVPRAPEELKGNKEVNLAVAKAVRIADRIRAKYCGVAIKKAMPGQASPAAAQQHRVAPAPTHQHQIGSQNRGYAAR